MVSTLFSNNLRRRGIKTSLLDSTEDFQVLHSMRFSCKEQIKVFQPKLSARSHG